MVSRKKKFPVPRNTRVISNVRKFEIVEDIIAIENVATDKIVQNVTNRAIKLWPVKITNAWPDVTEGLVILVL